MKHVSLQLTEDGSHTLFNAELNETYHSHKGALAESRYVFIHAGLEQVLQDFDHLAILEVGFGTGLNALMTLGKVLELTKARQQSGLAPLPVRYVTIEPYPLSAELIEGLNYKGMLPDWYAPLFDALHAAPWDQDVEVMPGFVLRKVKGKLEQLEWQGEPFNLVYYDAFAPSKQPDVWALDNFKKCYGLLEQGGLLVSYCANGQFKRDLKAAGFQVKAYPGALGKREMTRAWKLDSL
ncbi:tRNA (5-methylaminomethyl-2-thiouridine)(34)-methyltransferase MnmD [Shewanella algae]|uniref:tRNA (5-methylaminomethyl-2-thiouridine)(34)-methyltransferase MnmD n=1 Tax=Shewanella algae TaxID=38313 RepID=UPI003007897B